MSSIIAAKRPSQSPFSRIDPIANPRWADNLEIAVCSNRAWLHRKLAALAQEADCDAVEMLLRIVAEDPQTRIISHRSFDADSFFVFEQSKDACFGTDNGCVNYGVTYREQPDFPAYESTPSAFCGMIRLLEDTRLSFPQVIHRLAARAAKAAGYSDRGSLEIGKAADILIIDREELKSGYDEARPQTQPSGLSHSSSPVRSPSKTGGLPTSAAGNSC